ncbi:MAG: HPr(Ser) kinase/phosphatase [Ruminococcaceae bacterium]|nr:HPr(Ser) kinase/phosphatase [Oscillospiraceae bacterium]
MSENRTIALQKVIDELSLEVIYSPEPPEDIQLTRMDVTRPGLQLAGFFDHFEPKRMQIIGTAEFMYLKKMEAPRRREALTDFFSKHPAAVVFSHKNRPDEEILEIAEYFEVPVLATESSTSPFMAALIAYLSVALAPMITRHGVLVEVYGEGMLILGDSGVGKSETAIELIKRGHRLIADDAVEIRRVSAKTLVGQAPEMIRHYIELRGIGIIDVRRIFGMGAVKMSEKIDIIINLEPWEQGKMYNRMGLDEEYMDIMGIKVPSTTIPVKPGRNLAIILEIAAMNNRQKKMGINAAKEFNRKLLENSGIDPDAMQEMGL